MLPFLYSLLSTLVRLRFAGAVICDECTNSNNNVCSNLGSCSGVYCLYENVNLYDGSVTLKKSCLSSPRVSFDDGSVLTVYNQCVSKETTKNGLRNKYVAKVCSDSNYCNRVCENPAPLPPMPICYQCQTNDGSECTSGTCQGQYCTYIRRRNGNSVYLQKDCTDQPYISFDDGSQLKTLNQCDTRTTQMYVYNSQLCTTNYCNAACNQNGDNPVNPPQRQPIVSCYSCEANNAFDCTGPTCQGNYCIYERQTPSTGVPYVKRSCGLLPYILYPDTTRSTTLEGCEYRLINGVRFATNVCNSNNFCNPGTCSAAYSLLPLPVIACVVVLLKTMIL